MRRLLKIWNKLTPFAVYLAGPINGCDDDDCKVWREVAKMFLPIIIYDPMDRDFRGKEATNVDVIVKGDLKDIGRSAFVIVNAKRPSWGTAMEIAYAYKRGKIIYAFGAGDKPSPWLVYHCDKMFPSVEQACIAVNDFCCK